jgi:DNA replication protein DnaC
MSEFKTTIKSNYGKALLSKEKKFVSEYSLKRKSVLGTGNKGVGKSFTSRLK